MNLRQNTVSLLVALMLGVGATVLAAETAQVAQVEVSFDQCSVNGRLTFKDRKGGCLQNHPTFFEKAGYAYSSPNFNFALSVNPAQCPAIHAWSWGNNTSYLSECIRKLAGRIGTVSPQCTCQPVEEIARNLTKEEFYEFERAFALRLKTGWSTADLSNPMRPGDTIASRKALAKELLGDAYPEHYFGEHPPKLPPMWLPRNPYGEVAPRIWWWSYAPETGYMPESSIRRLAREMLRYPPH